MKLFNIITLGIFISFLISCEAKKESKTNNSPENSADSGDFFGVCQDRNSSNEAFRTVSAIKEFLRTDSCEETRSALQLVNALILVDKDISDLSPLNGSIPKLNYLNLNDNQIEDISTLASFPNLVQIELDNNLIESIFQLKDLGNLEVLRAGDNPLGLDLLASEENCPTFDIQSSGVKDFCEDLFSRQSEDDQQSDDFDDDDDEQSDDSDDEEIPNLPQIPDDLNEDSLDDV